MIAAFREGDANAVKPRCDGIAAESHLTASAPVTIETRLSQ
ncbi:hypothetical protein OHAE_2482 [Ochrobactrum soli]|uniref:Uncharacterized protein n=1 Tax=Ochrobactrum soli TaxID=2448455 RepID=A0A2P9HR75_9HYPH|nr:hypothetical protein OHAE_2482 [[Ochrobactrum] soli]